MKSAIAACCTLLLFFSAAASAAPAAVKPQTVAIAAPSAAPAASEARTRPAAFRRHSRSASGDARYCLDLPNETAIVKCAEQYL